MTNKTNKLLPRYSLVIGAVCLVMLVANGTLAVFLVCLYNQHNFEGDALVLQQDISRVVGASEGVITTLAGFHQTDEQLDRYEFAAITQPLFETYPFISHIARFQVIYPEERAAFEADMATNGHYNFYIKKLDATSTVFVPREQADQYAPVVSVEPNGPLASRMVGMDFFMYGEFIEILDEAIETNSVALIVPPEGLGAQMTLFVVRPTYFGHYVPGNAADRLNQLEGGFIVITNIKMTIESIVDAMDFSAVDISLNAPKKLGSISKTVYKLVRKPEAEKRHFTALFAPFRWQATVSAGERSLVIDIERGFVLSGT